MRGSDFVERLLDGVAVEWKALGEVTLPTSNIRWKDAGQKYLYVDLASVSIETKAITAATEIDSSNAPSRAQKIIESDDVIFATTRPTQLRYCLIDDDYAGAVVSTGYCVLRAKKDEVLPGWILHWLSTEKFKAYVEENQSGAAYPALSDAKVKGFRLPIPCPSDPKRSLEIQAEIVRILSAFTELTAELNVELTARKKQYGYYRDRLLAFEEGGAEWKTLGDVALIQRGASPRPISKFITDDETGVPWIKIGDTSPGSKYVNETAQRITQEGARSSRVLDKGDFILSNSMSFGRPYILGITGAIHDGWASISKFSDVLSADFLYHYLSSNAVKNYWTGKINSGSVSNLNAEIIRALPVPIPSLAQQKRIAIFLDKFDALTNSEADGLPREIELRQKQYSYYRNSLLSFPEVEGVKE